MILRGGERRIGGEPGLEFRKRLTELGEELAPLLRSGLVEVHERRVPLHIDQGLLGGGRQFARRLDRPSFIVFLRLVIPLELEQEIAEPIDFLRGLILGFGPDLQIRPGGGRSLLLGFLLGLPRKRRRRPDGSNSGRSALKASMAP